MAPAPSPIPVHSPDHQSSRHLHHRRQALDLIHQLPRQLLRTEQHRARTLDAALQPSIVLEGPPPAPVGPVSSKSVAPAPGPSVAPVGNNRPIGMTGNIVAAVVVIVLILGGLISLVVGGELLRRRMKITEKKVLAPPSRYSRHRKSKPVKSPASSPQHNVEISHEKVSFDEKTLTPTPPARPPPVLNRERRRRLSDVWPIRSLSMALCSRRSCSEQVEHNLQHSPPVASPQTTWSEFSSISHYVAPTRTILSCIPEELEDCQSQTNSDIAAILGVTLERSLQSGLVVPTQASKSKSSQNVFPTGSSGLESLVATETRDEDNKSLGSSAPDMTADGGESSRSSIASLESLEDGNDRESLKEEVFELRRAQTRSMQMNRGVLLSLSLKTLDDNEILEPAHGGCPPSRSPSTLDTESGREYGGRELSLAIFGRNLSAVNLDEFPSPPSILPMIPSFVSSF